MKANKKTSKSKFSELLDFLELDIKEIRKILVVVVVSALFNVILLYLINNNAKNVDSGHVSLLQMCLYLVALSIFLLGKVYAQRESASQAETAILKIRLRILNKLRRLSVDKSEKIAKEKLLKRISSDAGELSFSVPLAVFAFQALVVLCFVLIYMAIFSWIVFLLVILAFYIALGFYVHNGPEIGKEFEEINIREEAFLSNIDHLTSGFKELYLNKRKGEAFYNDIQKQVNEAFTFKEKSTKRFTSGFLLLEGSLYIIFLFLLFFIPSLTSGLSNKTTTLVTMVFFIIQPALQFMANLHNFSRTFSCIGRIVDFEKMIGEKENIEDEKPINLSSFKSIGLHQAEFSYDIEGSKTFTIGPINFEVTKGELVCIMGGNGSGKSSLMNMIAGLYHLEKGNIQFNGEALEAAEISGYRELFSAVFSDYHLFPRIHGMEMDEQKVNEWIKLFGIEDKVQYADGNYSTLKLSTGQSKRLALISALVEERPVLLLDEVTSDQDPQFKKYFYNDLLPELKKQGRTVILITHDDRFKDRFDRVIEMEFGSIVS